MKYRQLLVVLSLLWMATTAHAADPFFPPKTERVVFVGNTLIEREQRYGYWETAFTSRYPDRNLTFRNLGWSGDTVFGHARAGFGTTASGFKHLKEHVLSLKPNRIVVGYGANEAFDGPDGLPKFEAGLNTLLDTFSETKAQIVLLGPPPQEDLGRPLPDPEQQNKNLRLYRDAIRAIAKKREVHFVDFYDLFTEIGKGPAGPLTENGIHLDAQGYYRTIRALEKGFNFPTPNYATNLQAGGKVGDGKTATGTGLKVEALDTLKWKITAEMLPLPPSPSAKHSLPGGGHLIRIEGLQGRHTLFIDGKEILSTEARQWELGVTLHNIPEVEQAEKLRQAIIEKNRLYFHRWRPQNETYLFGFRKHEQGKNSVEIPQFDPLVVNQEDVIAKLRVPVAHVYEWKKAK